MSRYKNSSAVLFWELGNELNLQVLKLTPCASLHQLVSQNTRTTNRRVPLHHALLICNKYTLPFTHLILYARAHTSLLLPSHHDLLHHHRFQVNLPCAPFTGTKCFNTTEMMAWTSDLVSVIRSVDPMRPISSGFALQRSASWHMENRE